MLKTIEPNFQKITEQNRIFYHLKGEQDGPILVFFAGVHGNEIAGVNGLNNSLKDFDSNTIKGEVYAVYGNVKALNSSKRYIERDLNRVWTDQCLEKLERQEKLLNEDKEQFELLYFLSGILENTQNPIYFIDLHTTSSKSLPFITINDTLINRKFSECFPVPIILGIEEYLDGTLLSYLNTMGYVSIGFEAGQHDDALSIENCTAFINLVLSTAGAIPRTHEQILKKSQDLLKSSSEHISDFFEIIYKYHIKPDENFEMIDGFESFQNIEKGELLAQSNSNPIYSVNSGKIFMPLYQKSGEDGFFIIRFVPRFYLWLSKFLRRFNADSLLATLPGINWKNKNKGILVADLKITRFFAKQLFHLLGFRQKTIDKHQMLLYNRERVSKNKMYKNEIWYKKSHKF